MPIIGLPLVQWWEKSVMEHMWLNTRVIHTSTARWLFQTYRQHHESLACDRKSRFWGMASACIWSFKYPCVYLFHFYCWVDRYFTCQRHIIVQLYFIIYFIRTCNIIRKQSVAFNTFIFKGNFKSLTPTHMSYGS